MKEALKSSENIEIEVFSGQVRIGRVNSPEWKAKKGRISPKSH